MLCMVNTVRQGHMFEGEEHKNIKTVLEHTTHVLTAAFSNQKS